MAKTVDALRVRQNLGEILNQAYYGGDIFVVQRAKQPMVAIISIKRYLKWERMQNKAFSLIEKVAERINLPEKEALELVQKAREKMVK